MAASPVEYTMEKTVSTPKHSGKVTFPATAGNSVKKKAIPTIKEHQVNPFKMPADNDIFLLRDKERQQKQQERLRQRTLKVHEKTTYANRINFKTSAMIHPVGSDDDADKVEEDDGKTVKDHPQFTLAVTKDRHVEKESLADYISKKREMFLVQYALGVKRDEMRKLEEIASAEERKLELAEQYLEEDAAMFDEFLKENDKNSVEAIKIAETETKAKLEKVAEIKRINAQMMGYRSEISKYEETLKEYRLYKTFLEALTPKEWMEQRTKEREQRREELQQERSSRQTDTLTDTDKSDSRMSKKKGGVKGGAISSRSNASIKSKSNLKMASDSRTSMTDDEDEDEEEQQLYFSDAQQLLDIFAELEEQNLSLIQNSQETEEALEEMKQKIKCTKITMDKETRILREQIEKLKSAIEKEEERGRDLQVKAKLFSYGEFKSDDQEKMLESLNKKVEEVYRSCIGENEANIGTLQMLTNIENRLEELFETVEMMPQDKVEAAEKAKEKERRLRLRELKIEEQRLHQEERIRRALERAKADPKKKTGRKLVMRSEPPPYLKMQDDGADQATREEEELAYFFT